MNTMTSQDMEFAERLLYDYSFFSRHVQKIEPKDLEELDEQARTTLEILRGSDPLAGLIPFLMHPGQMRLIEAIEDQLRRTGKVRKALVKPRQVGWSTAIQGYAHFRATQTPGMKIQIVSHTDKSTKKFLQRVKKMCEAAPSVVTPGRQVDNANEIVFTNGSSYSISTAGNPDAVRSDSCHFLHASEEAYWKEAAATTAAILPALSKGIGSYGFRESTSKGKGTPWHTFIQRIQVPFASEWELFFDAWFMHPKYRMTPPKGWEPDDEAKDAQRLYKLDIEQLYWRAMMIVDLRALWYFKQEFPGTVEESFQAPEGTLYNPDAITTARYNAKNSKISLDKYAPLIMGCDPARTGDRTIIAFRQGNILRAVLKWPKMDDMRLVGIIGTFLRDGFEGTPVAKCFIDYAIGEGPASRLRELGYSRLITTVNFGATPREPDRYANKRIEMAMDLQKWLGDGDLVSIPDDDDISSDLLAIPDFMQMEGSDKLKLPPKEKIKKEFGKSPDIFDAFILTFAFPVIAERVADLQQFARDNLSHLPVDQMSAIMRDFAGY